MRANATSSQVNGILAQIHRESSGNERAIQNSAVWDVNMANGNPARGLLQYIPSTFNHYKVAGYGNIMNGFHQLMAFFNNSRWRSDLPYGTRGWGPSGYPIRPYAKGTPWVPEDQLALIHKGEMVVPAAFNPNNPANSSTLQMPSIFREEMSPQAYTPSSGDTSNGGMSTLERLLVKLLEEKNDNQDSKTEVVLKVSEDELGRVSIKAINKYQEKIGYTALNL